MWIACYLFLSISQVAAEILFEKELPPVGNLISIEAQASGTKVDLIVDTGADLTSLDNDLSRLAISKPESVIIHGYDGTIPTDLARIASVQIQKVIDENVTIAFLDVPGKTYVDPKLQGVLGVEQMKKGKLLIDFDKAMLALHDDNWRLSESDCTIFPLQRESSPPMIHSAIDAFPLTFLIDTGNDTSVGLPKEFFEKLRDLGYFDSRTLDLKSGPLEMYWFKKGTLMGVELAGIRVDPLEHNQIGVLGLGWLSKFNLEVDFASKDRFLRAQKRINPSPPINLRLTLGGILEFTASGATIIDLRPDQSGPLEVAGAEVGDQIVSVGKLEGSSITAASLRKLVAQNTGKRIPIRLLSAENSTPRSMEIQIDSLISDWDFPGRSLVKEK